MGLIDGFRRKRLRVQDPVFGELTYDRSRWRGEAEFRAHAGAVAVAIESDEGGPTGEQRDRFTELDRRYVDLLPGIGQALWELYRPVRAELADEAGARPGPAGADEMLGATELFQIDITRDGTIGLGYGFVPGVGWDDAMFTVAIDGWTPRPVGLDD